MMLLNIGFSVKNDVPYSVFGDAVSLSLQNFVIIYLIWKYNTEIGVIEKIIAFSVISGLMLMLLQSDLDSNIWDIILDCSTLLSKYHV